MAAVPPGRHRRWRDQQLGRRVRDAADRHAHVLRHGLHRGAGLQRPAVEPVVRLQAWGVQRVAELYYASGNAQAKAILDKWVPWGRREPSSTRTAPTGRSRRSSPGPASPDTWNKTSSPGANSGLSVTVKSYGQDVGVAGDTARRCSFYAAKSGDTASRDKAKALLDAIWASNQDSLGVRHRETRADFLRFDDTYVAGGNGVYVPSGWTGTMPNGDVDQAGRLVPGHPHLVQERPAAGRRSRRPWPPAWRRTFTFHRFWAQTAIAGALGDYARLFEGAPRPPVDTTAPIGPDGSARRHHHLDVGHALVDGVDGQPVAPASPATTSTAARRRSAPRPPRRTPRPA